MKSTLTLCALGLALAGCAQHRPGLREIDLRDAYVESHTSALGASSLSRDAEAFLGLHADAGASPEELLVALEVPSPTEWVDLAELCYQRAQANPKDAASDYLSTAISSYTALFGNARGEALDPFEPRFQRASDLYRMALAALVADLWRDREALRQGVAASWIGGDVTLIADPGRMPWTVTDAVRAIPADSHAPDGFAVHGRRGGLGAPVVLAWERESSTDHRVPQVAPLRPATLLLIPETRGAQRCRLRLVDPFLEPTLDLAGRQVPIAADLGIPLALLLSENEGVDGMSGLMDVASFSGGVGLYTLGPYRPGAIPVVFVHGLMSRPLTWLPMASDLLGDRELTEATQAWFFLYPTGNPILESAALLRESLAGARQHFDPQHRDPALDQIVLVGHSMGGVLSRLMVQAGGDPLWQALSEKPLADVALAPADRTAIERLLYFAPAPGVARAVFIAAPHRGAEMADSGLAGLAASMIKLPGEVARTTLRARAATDSAALDQFLPRDRAATGIDGLSPRNPVLLASVAQPIAVPFHTLAGRKSAGADSDGLVPIASAHMDGAESELLVDSDHSVHTRPHAIAEVRRILLEHLRRAAPTRK